MNDERVARAAAPDPPTQSPGGASVVRADVTPHLAMPLATEKEATMSPTDSYGQAPAASMAGSLSAFTLSDVLTLLASTSQTGELQVVSETVDGKLWLDAGELSNARVGTAATIGQAVFELACATEGWFYFTTGLISSSGQPTVPVAAVLNEVLPQVVEWQEIREVVPLEATVNLSPTPPGQDVQIRKDQWQVLTTVGNSGHSVKAVLDAIGGDQIVGLRTLRDLRAAGLIVLGPAPTDQAEEELAPTFSIPSDIESAITSLPSTEPITLSGETPSDELGIVTPPLAADAPVASGDDRFNTLAEVTIMPPPIAADPWALSVESNKHGDGASTDEDGVA